MRLLLLFTLICFATILTAQDIIVITGKVIDEETQKPLGYAHVGVPEAGIGTITGGDGGFVLKLPNRLANANFMISFLGYETYRTSVSRLKSPVTIRLKQSATNLLEVVVMDESRIEDIIRRAVRRIPQNYPTKPSKVQGFYRESRTNSDRKYMYLAEGVLEIYKTSYENKKEGQTGLIEGRQVSLIPPEELEEYSSFYSGHLAGHRFDFVKNREDFIDENYFEDYRYWIEGITVQSDHPVYIIGFEGEENRKNGRMEGTLYIDTLSYAFLRAEFKINKKGLKRYDDYPLYRGNWKGNKYIVNYRQLGEKWYFSDALREGVYRDGGVYSNEVLVTEINGKKGKVVPYLDRLDRNMAFINSTGEYDEHFWKDYNTAPLNAGLRNSIQQAKTAEKATEVFDSTFLANLKRERDSIRLQEEMAKMELEMAGDEDYEKQLERLQKLESLDKKRQKVQESSWKVQGQLGLGTHLLQTGAANMGLTYYTKDDAQVIISTLEDLSARNFEVYAHADLNIFFHKNFYFRWGFAFDFWNSIYKESAQGFGTQFNISKGRPFFVRATVQHSNLKYARKIGQAENDFGDFKADKKKFKADHINMYYGSRTHNLKSSLEFALELHPSMEVFVRGTYLLPFARQQHIYLWERKEIFRKKARVPLNDQFQVEQNGLPFSGRILDENSLMFSIGVVFK